MGDAIIAEMEKLRCARPSVYRSESCLCHADRPVLGISIHGRALPKNRMAGTSAAMTD